jgi:hypothetical protein
MTTLHPVADWICRLSLLIAGLSNGNSFKIVFDFSE